MVTIQNQYQGENAESIVMPDQVRHDVNEFYSKSDRNIATE